MHATPLCQVLTPSSRLCVYLHSSTPMQRWPRLLLIGYVFSFDHTLISIFVYFGSAPVIFCACLPPCWNDNTHFCKFGYNSFRLGGIPWNTVCAADSTCCSCCHVSRPFLSLFAS